MIILDSSNYDENSISSNLGRPEYSYWFVRKAFRPILAKIGIVIPISNPEREVDRIYRAALADGQACVFVSFNPPNLTPINTDCPVIPVFAWEFDTIPNESWGGEPKNDWTYVLSKMAAAVTHCSSSVNAVRRSMGADYPIWSIPAPIADKCSARAAPARGWQRGVRLGLENAMVFDTHGLDLSLLNSDNSLLLTRAMSSLKRRSPTGCDSRILVLDGAVYTTVLNPLDGRKNWRDMVGAFVCAFLNEQNATLIIKATHRDFYDGVVPILRYLAKLGRFSCRIIVIHGLLDEAAYSGLIDATSYAVNTSDGEGQCLPLMEFMSSGRPAVAPRHTAMIDYINRDNAFIIADDQRPSSWPADVRQATRCLRHQIDFMDLVRNYRESFLVARDSPGIYARMSAAAKDALMEFCSDDVVRAGMAQVMEHLGLATTSRPAPNPAVA